MWRKSKGSNEGYVDVKKEGMINNEQKPILFLHLMLIQQMTMGSSDNDWASSGI